MSDHRRTVSRRAFVLPGWALVGSALVVVLAAGALAALLVTGYGDDAPVAAPSESAAASPTPSPSEASPTPSATEASKPEPTEDPEPTPTPAETTPAVDRSAVAVSVLNASRTQGLARTVGQQVTADGWTVAAVGNWRGYSAANTVHYPQGREAEARQLAADLGVQAVAPIVNGMSGQRLTVILVGPVG